MANVQMLEHGKQYRIDLDDEDLDDLWTIQLEKKTTTEATIEACFHAGLVTILTHSPRKYKRKQNHVKEEKKDKS